MIRYADVAPGEQTGTGNINIYKYTTCESPPSCELTWNESRKGALSSPTVRSLEKETETVRLVMDWRNREKSDSTKELVKFENLGVSPQAYRINIPGWGQAFICTKKPSS